MYAAVVYCAENGVVSRRPEGDYSCFIGATKDEAIKKALKAKSKWDGYKSDTTGKTYTYTVCVGRLTTVAVPTYEEHKL